MDDDETRVERGWSKREGGVERGEEMRVYDRFWVMDESVMKPNGDDCYVYGEMLRRGGIVKCFITSSQDENEMKKKCYTHNTKGSVRSLSRITYIKIVY